MSQADRNHTTETDNEVSHAAHSAPNRRALILASAAALVAHGAPAVATADPVFGLIAAHREASAAFSAACADYSKVEAEWYANSKPRPKPADLQAAEAASHAAGDRDDAAEGALYLCTPTTLAGALARLDYFNEMIGRGHEAGLNETDRGPGYIALIETTAAALRDLARA
jgi:hypothetical protein